MSFKNVISTHLRRIIQRHEPDIDQDQHVRRRIPNTLRLRASNLVLMHLTSTTRLKRKTNLQLWPTHGFGDRVTVVLNNCYKCLGRECKGKTVPNVRLDGKAHQVRLDHFRKTQVLNAVLLLVFWVSGDCVYSTILQYYVVKPNS
eukprot:2534303-Amphidinium_carterae.1